VKPLLPFQGRAVGGLGGSSHNQAALCKIPKSKSRDGVVIPGTAFLRWMMT